MSSKISHRRNAKAFNQKVLNSTKFELSNRFGDQIVDFDTYEIENISKDIQISKKGKSREVKYNRWYEDDYEWDDFIFYELRTWYPHIRFFLCLISKFKPNQDDYKFKKFVQ